MCKDVINENIVSYSCLKIHTGKQFYAVVSRAYGIRSIFLYNKALGISLKPQLVVRQTFGGFGTLTNVE